MNDYTHGIVKIKEKKKKGLFKKYYIYGGGLNGAPGIYGYSYNRNLKKEYNKGDEVKVRYSIFTGSRKNDYDEVMKFYIIED